jgi:hypothetical protein
MTTSRPEAEPGLTIPGVPQSITRADYIALIESLGLKPNNLVELELSHRSIRAVVFARDADGKMYLDGFERNEVAKHTITIPIVD